MNTSESRQSASILLLAVSLLPVSFARAHHGGAVEWASGVFGPVTGTATEFVFRFPHVVVYMDVEVDGEIENWAMTTRWTPTILRRLGWRHDSINPGDTLTMTYRRHVTDPAVFQMQTIQVDGVALSLDPN